MWHSMQSEMILLNRTRVNWSLKSSYAFESQFKQPRIIRKKIFVIVLIRYILFLII